MMDKATFADHFRARKEEIAELEEIVREFAASDKTQTLLKGARVEAFRKGMIACFDWFDRKAIALKEKRDFAAQMKNDSRGLTGFTPKE